MSRDPYIWVVMPKGMMTPEAAFSRKYECSQYLAFRSDALPPAIIYRFAPYSGACEVVTV